MRKMPAHFSTSTISAGIRRDVSISNARALMAGPNSWIALSKDLPVSDEGDMPEAACLVSGERKRLLMIVPWSLIFVGDLSTKHHKSRKDPRRHHRVSFRLPSDR